MSRAFGIGVTHNYNIFLVGDAVNYTYLDLILPDGGRVRYNRISPGSSYINAVYQHTTAPSAFFNSYIGWTGGWTLTFKDGTVWTFGDGNNKTPTQAGLLSITDRFGNSITVGRDLSTGNVNQITSSSGRFIALSYDSSGRITQAQDNAGRTVQYSYDTSGRLAQVVDANGGVTAYGYDAYNRLLTITDPRGITYLTNYYDPNGRVIEQDLADGGVFHFSYQQDGNGNIVQTDVTNPRGYVSSSDFDTNGYYSGGNLTSFTQAAGRPEQQLTTYQYDPAGSGLLVSTTDPLSRRTAFLYDGCANTTSVTRLAGTASPVTTLLTYQTPQSGAQYPCVSTNDYNQITSVTDPLGHTTTFAYDSTGKNLTGITDPLSHSVTITAFSSGQPASIANSAGTTSFGYAPNADLVTITDATANTTSRTLDSIGRLVALQAPLGQVTR